MNNFEKRKRQKARKIAKKLYNRLMGERFALPLIRRIYPNLIANELVSVQPMKEPSGKIFYLDYKYPEREEIQVMAIYKIKD